MGLGPMSLFLEGSLGGLPVLEYTRHGGNWYELVMCTVNDTSRIVVPM